MPADPQPSVPAPVDRGGRRRARTRASLMAAALELFAERGIEATRIADITDRADVGFGSFYNHFADKDEIVREVVTAAIEAEGVTVDRLTAGLEDPAEVLAVAHRYFVRVAGLREHSAWVLVRMDLGDHIFAATVGARAAGHLMAGVEAGRFDVADPGLALEATGGALVGVMRRALREDQVGTADPAGATTRPVDELHAELVLRMLGLAAGEAREVAARPFPVVLDD